MPKIPSEVVINSIQFVLENPRVREAVTIRDRNRDLTIQRVLAKIIRVREDKVYLNIYIDFERVNGNYASGEDIKVRAIYTQHHGYELHEMQTG